jgi:hypothetical protein
MWSVVIFGWGIGIVYKLRLRGGGIGFWIYGIGNGVWVGNTILSLYIF